MNRRRHLRQPIHLSALVHPEQVRSWLCSIRDFCEEGMLLVGGTGSRSLQATGALLEGGTTIALHFSVPSQNGHQHFRVQARIARTVDSGNGLGVTFPSGLDMQAFRALGEFAVATGTAVPDELPEPRLEDLADVATVGPDGVTPLEGAPLQGSAQEKSHERLPAIPEEAAQRLKQRIRTVAQRAATRLGAAFIEAANKEMLIRARDAGTNAIQARYMEALDSLERHDQSFLAEFVSSVIQQIEQVADLDAALERRRRRESGNSNKLELVDTDQFEEWLTVAELISKAEDRFKDGVLDMRAQFGLLAKPWSHKDVLPVGPSVICWAFDDAQKVFEFRHDLRKEVYALFEREFYRVLQSLYGALGKLFEDSGLVKSLDELRQAIQPRYTIRSRAGVTVAPEDYQDMDTAVREVAMAADGVGGRRIDHNPFTERSLTGNPSYQTARSMLGLGRRTQELLGLPRSPGLAAQGAAAEDIFHSGDIIDALSVIQSELGDAPLSDIRLKPRLLEVLRDQHGEHKGLTEEDYDTLEVMEGLVTSLTDDRLITEGVREWVQRLAITLNKLAAQDPNFLTGDPDNPHSAIQMLNQLARLGNARDMREGIDREVGRRVDELLQRVVTDFDDNPEVFREVVDELHPLIDRQSRTYRGNVERTVRASEGQQKLARARRAVIRSVGDIIGDEMVADLLLDLLNPGWRNLLVHSHLRHGPESNEWRDQLAVIANLHQQTCGKVTEAHPEYVEPEKLLRQVVDGLNSISFDPGKRTPLVMRMSAAIVGDTTGVKEPINLIEVALSDVDEVLGLREMLPDVDPQIESTDEDVRDNWSKAVDRARRIQVGEWLAASDREGRPLILTVAFVGDDSSSFVLVNRKGIKALERTLREMSDDLHQGNITLLDDYDLPLMERASQRMLENMHHQLAFQASHDDLTQLMNRREFDRVIETGLRHARSSASQHALLYLDLDQFKIVNNTSGHRAGDALLRQVGEALGDRFVNEGHHVARLGGDEFGILIEDVESGDARQIADGVLDLIRGIRFDWEDRHYNLTASMGLVFVDQSTESVDSLMQHADEACFSAKDAGRNRVQEYELGDTRMIKRHGAMEWVTQLDQALEDDRLILNCQKIAPVTPGEDNHDHYEILLTMLDELGDVVAPTELIDAAETYNRMTTVDRWVVTKVLAWMADHRTMLDHFGGFAINVSGHSVNDTTFADFVLAQFGRTQAPTSKICFEITETAAIANLDNAIDFMNRMRIIGCSFSLDDFGTGLSSYSYLRNLPVDYVKIDGVFVRDITDSPADFAVVRSINEIGHYMGKKTIAEYVEDADILQQLREIGVDYAQGFEISKPGLLQDLQVA